MAVRCLSVYQCWRTGGWLFLISVWVSALSSPHKTLPQQFHYPRSDLQSMCALAVARCIYISPRSRLAAASIACAAFSAVVKIHFEECSSQFVVVVSRAQFFRLFTMQPVCSELCGLSSTTRTLFSCFKKSFLCYCVTGISSMADSELVQPIPKLHAWLENSVRRRLLLPFG